MKTSVTSLAMVATLVLAACGSRISVGFIDGPDAGGFSTDGGPSPPPFDPDAAPRPETGPPSPGCEDKNCGDFCKPCGGASACPSASQFHVCSSEGQCLPAQPGCITIAELDASPPASYVPCAGLTCGDACTSCDPGLATCTAPVTGVCHRDGACAAAPAGCQ